ncbi:MAG TPA: hypothetical protein VJS37_03990 [Terriglobales bacterium]|nr:hypothetical protein [Terriglobales bacterium]
MKHMAAALKPKLFDVVRFKRTTAEALPSLATGTVVEVLAPDSVLVEISDTGGISKEIIPVPIRDLEIVWSGKTQESNNPRYAENYFEEGLLLFQNGVPNALEKFRKAIELQPNLAGSLLNLTNSLSQKREYGPALFLYAFLSELRPDYALARNNLAITHLNRGVDHAHAGALDKAIEDFTAALAFSRLEEVSALCRSNLAATHTKLGLYHIQIKRFDEAFQFFLGALHADPSATTRRNYALALLALVAWRQETIPDIKDVSFFRDPMLMGLSYSECLNAYGATLASLGKTSQAREMIERAVQAEPENQLARNNLLLLNKQKLSDTVPPEMWGLTSAEPRAASLATVSA